MDKQSLQDELLTMIHTANLWKMRARAATRLALYFNSIYNAEGAFMHDEDIKREIERQAQRMLDDRPRMEPVTR